jgi:hypothetical protein
MTAKRASEPRKAASKGKSTPKAASSVSSLTEGAVLVILESPESSSSAAGAVDLALRRQLVAAEAYFIAERRGFSPGHEFDDWVAAEAAVESRLAQGQAAKPSDVASRPPPPEASSGRATDGASDGRYRR